MLNCQFELEINGEEFVTSIGHSDEFYVKFTFRPLYLSTDVHTYG